MTYTSTWTRTSVCGQALGFQMRAERTLLRDFVRYVETHGDAGPIRAQLGRGLGLCLVTPSGARVVLPNA